METDPYKSLQGEELEAAAASEASHGRRSEAGLGLRSPLTCLGRAASPLGNAAWGIDPEKEATWLRSLGGGRVPDRLACIILVLLARRCRAHGKVQVPGGFPSLVRSAMARNLVFI